MSETLSIPGTSDPCDPNDPFYKRVCFVCSEEAKPNQEHLRNYGAIVCLSCRAFFRRAHQTSKTPAFDCKFDSKCKITVKNRRRCQGCRHNRCLKAGMAPEMVLTREQKTIRFRKLLLKKQNQKGRSRSGNRNTESESSTVAADADDDEEGDDDDNGGSLINELEDFLEDDSFEAFGSAEIKTETEVDAFSFDHDESGVQDELERIEIEYKSAFQRVIGKSSKQMKDDASAGAEETLRQFSRVFQLFALSLSEYSSLPQGHQKTLLNRNSPLFLQLQIAKYFKRSKASTSSSKSDSKFNRKAQEQFEEAIPDFFKAENDLDYYKNLVGQVNERLNRASEEEATLAYVVLFDADDDDKHSDADCVPTLDSVKKYLIDIKIDVKKLLDLLVKMSVIFSHNLAADDGLHKLLVMPYTQEEENWIQFQFRLISEAYESVSAGEYLLNEFTMLSLGVPLSKNYFSSVTAVGLERISRMCKTQPAYADLPVFERARILEERSFLGFCLLGCKADSCKTGMEQLQLGFGIFDQDLWKERFKSVFSKQEVRKIGFLESAVDMSRAMTTEQKIAWSDNVERVANVVEDPFNYSAIMLLVLTLPDDSTKSISRLHFSYKNLVTRRHESKNLESDFGNEFSKVLNGLFELKNILNNVQSKLLSLAVSQQPKTSHNISG